MDKAQAPGRMMIKVVGILFIIASGIGIVSAFITLATADVIAGTAFGAVASTLRIIAVYLIVASAWGLIVGILGVKHCGNLEKAGLLRTLAIISLAANVAYMIFSGFSFLALLDLVLPILFLVGAQQNVTAKQALGGNVQPPSQDDN